MKHNASKQRQTRQKNVNEIESKVETKKQTYLEQNKKNTTR
jgi:hypothetical protein